MLQSNLSIGPNGHLLFAGQDTVALAERYGTPLYLLDEERVRANCRLYTRPFARCFAPGSLPYYSSKALCFKALYPILLEEGMGADVVSGGELLTALAAGFPAEKLCFQGNNKTPEEIRLGVEKRVGLFTVDNLLELERLDAEAARAGIRQRVLLRLTPGIDPHTFAAVNTGRIDCQFGVPVETGQAREFILRALRMPHLEVAGYHCHIGSQIFDFQPFADAAQIVLDVAAAVRDEAGYTPSVLNLGGGFGVRYKEDDPVVDIPACIERLSGILARLCEERGLPLPAVSMEPGRSIVADAGVTLYTAGPVKVIEGYRSYVVVDGGMSDNPRYALYQAPYTVLNASRAGDPCDGEISIAGRCCETGALIQENVPMARPKTGEIVAVLVTGAYNYSMASNYNRVCRPPIVLLSGGKSRVAVRRETWADMTACDL